MTFTKPSTEIDVMGCNWERWASWRVVILLGGLSAAAPVQAAISELSAAYTSAANPNGNWAFGYLSAGGSTSQDTDNKRFVETGALPSASPGFVVYSNFDASANPSGGGWRHPTFNFPLGGHWFQPSAPIQYAPGGGPLTDWLSPGENPNYPNGIVGGHTPNCTFCAGWAAVRYTAPASGPVDIEVVGWQVTTYPDVPPNPPFGGATRDQQVRIDKQVGATRTGLVRAPFGPRHGITNMTGTPVYSAAAVPAPNEGVAGFYPTKEEELAASIYSSAHPNRYRLTNVNLNAGESIVVSLAAKMGMNFTGFMGLNATVRSGADRVATTRWDLADDWNLQTPTATGIGPDAAWSYGILKNGSFAPYDRIVEGSPPQNTTGNQNHAWGTQDAGWFVAGAPDPGESPLVPGMVKDSNGINSLTTGTLVNDPQGAARAPLGDWTGGKVALHTPPIEVDAAQTSVIRWTAPQNMTVQANGGMWRLTLPDATDRRHQYELRKGATVLASGTIDELTFGPTGENSFNPEDFSVNNIAVVTGDVLELRISPLVSGGNLPADFDGNGVVDGADFAQWRDDLGVNADSDADGDGDSDGADFLAWQRDFGMSGGGGGANATPGFIGVDFTVSAAAGALATVPEPGAFALLCAAAICLANRRQKAG